MPNWRATEDDATQQAGVVGGADRIVAVLQIHLELAGAIFADDGGGGDVLRCARLLDRGQDRLVFVELGQR